MGENKGKSGWSNAYARRFFEHEYRLDYRIHTYPKPVLCWGHGIVMGGGIGLMMGASHRVVSEPSRLAMPEVSIGLFPDVGGSWLLNRMPGRIGLFLALTGAHMNTADAFFAAAGVAGRAALGRTGRGGAGIVAGTAVHERRPAAPRADRAGTADPAGPGASAPALIPDQQPVQWQPAGRDL
ncbi:hypothetical protein G6F32_015082 [Rhizopus arrhizus]|nr:hypothetical protein G6F32_015082 [Rhizopus arrhizus]